MGGFPGVRYADCSFWDCWFRVCQNLLMHNMFCCPAVGLQGFFNKAISQFSTTAHGPAREQVWDSVWGFSFRRKHTSGEQKAFQQLRHEVGNFVDGLRKARVLSHLV